MAYMTNHMYVKYGVYVEYDNLNRPKPWIFGPKSYPHKRIRIT